MTTSAITSQKYWQNKDVKKLSTHGRLALLFVLFLSYEWVVYLEDMALVTGLDEATCIDWLEHFKAAGLISSQWEWQ